MTNSNPVKNSAMNAQTPPISRIKLVFCTILVLAGVFAHQSDSFADDREAQFSIPLTEKGTDVFYLPARLGDTDTELLFDTGSGYLALNERIMGRLEDEGRASYLHSIHARMASGAVNKVDIYRVEALRLGDSCTLYNVDAAMLKGSTRNILGMNVLKQVASFNVSFSDNTLTLKGCNGQPQQLTAGL